MRNIIHTIKEKGQLPFLLLFFTLFSLTNVWAEGSKDYYPSGAQGNRGFLMSTPMATFTGPGGTSFPFLTKGTHYVYAKAGETIATASSANAFRGYIRLIAPDGTTTYTSRTSTGNTRGSTASTAGYIYGNTADDRRANELAGPRVGYTPFERVVEANQEGIWKVEFISTAGDNQTNENVTQVSVRANAGWTNGDNTFEIAAWDVSVRNTANTAWIPGRVYTNVMNLVISADNFYETRSAYMTNYVLTKDGYVYEWYMNGGNGVGWNHFANSKGFVDINNQATYKSKNYTTDLFQNYILDPRGEDGSKGSTHKLFYNKPATDMPTTSTGAVPGGSTWLWQTRLLPVVSNVAIVGVEGTTGQMGKKGANVKFDANLGGTYIIEIESNDPLNPFAKRTMTGASEPGTNSIFWDGKDGNGQTVPPGDIPIKVSVHLIGGEVHFPYVDFEINPNGVVIKRLNTAMTAVEDDIIYWDDSEITGGRTDQKTNPMTMLTGVSSATGEHKWGTYLNGSSSTGSSGNSGTGSYSFGNDKSMDTWTYFTGEVVTITPVVFVSQADLQITEVTPNSTAIGEGSTLNITVKVKNDGPDGVTGAPFSFKLPQGFEHSNVVFTANGCGTEAVSIVYDSATHTYKSTVDLPNQCEITYTFTVTATSNVIPGAQNFEAAILRPNDVTDPDATNNLIDTPPTDPHFECDNNGLGGDCNNIESNNVVVFSMNYCVSGDCNPNTYVNSTGPNTIEYDSMVGLFHSSMVRESDGKIKVWGQGTKHNGTDQTNNYLVPMEVNSTNYPLLTGDVLKFTGASNVQTQQFAVLTTTGLFTWGNAGVLIPAGLQTAGTFTKQSIGTYGVTGTKADGLPNGVNPEDVKMLFGTHNTLAIVTCTGDAWVLSSNGNLYGDGATDNATNDIVWHQVTTSETGNPLLAGVVAMRGTANGLMALTSVGEIYTWGSNVRLGNNTAAANIARATKMTLPTGITPKMIGMTRSSAGLTHYVLATNSSLYALGENGMRQLGNGSTTNSNAWVQVTATSGANTLGGNIVWISPQEHEGGNYPAINVLTDEGKIWAWGGNNGNMIGGTNVGSNDPIYMPGSITGTYNAGKLNLGDTLIAVETGGHTTLTIKQCSTKFGYVGHRTNGSMANGSTAAGNDAEYNFADTSELSICGALAGPVVKDLTICKGTTANLVDAQPTSLPDGATSIQWWTTIDRQAGTQVTDPSSVGLGTYYAFYDPLIVNCPSEMTVRYRVAGDPDFNECTSVLITNPMIRQRVK